MSRKVELASEMDKIRSEIQVLVARKEAVKAELLKEVSLDAPVEAEMPKPKKRGRKPNSDKKLSLKQIEQIVQNILAKSKDGLELKDIVKEVHGMIQRKEYESTATDLSAVVSQAINNLKAGNIVNRNKESKKYTLVSAA